MQTPQSIQWEVLESFCTEQYSHNLVLKKLIKIIKNLRVKKIKKKYLYVNFLPSFLLGFI